MPEVRPIDANALFEFMQKERAWKQDTYRQPRYGRGKYDAYYEMLDIIKEQPTLDYEPVVHAHWIQGIDHEHLVGWCRCSACGRGIVKDFLDRFPKSQRCPNCGAKMDEEVKG